MRRERPNWDEFFMFSALWAAARSSCLYLQTGAVIVKDKRIIASGYNGAPPGVRNCLEVGCRKDREGVDFTDKGKAVCRGVHAEVSPRRSKCYGANCKEKFEKYINIYPLFSLFYMR